MLKFDIDNDIEYEDMPVYTKLHAACLWPILYKFDALRRHEMVAMKSVAQSMFYG